MGSSGWRRWHRSAQPADLHFRRQLTTTRRENFRALAAEYLNVLPRHVVAPISPRRRPGILFSRRPIRRILRTTHQHRTSSPARNQTMVRITAEGLDDCMFVDVDGNVLHPAVTPYVLMHDPKVHDTDRPHQLWFVTRDDPGYLPSKFQMESIIEAERACDVANARMGWTREEADRIVLASMGGGTA